VDCGGTDEVCGGVCESTLTDVAHCGACGERCSLESLCIVGVCSNGYADGDVRLAGGSAASGRVEVFNYDAFHTVCDDDFGDIDATVVCRQLGFSAGTVNGNLSGTGEIILDDVACTGTEARLIDCPNRGRFIHNCGHSEDVAVLCTP
jgi:deleted-in-malignant-brain-tumors protein 1